ncbi:cytochrome b5-like heme/steroid binding domain-containing protein [Rhodocollybia butyracea]|uniref:Cytochrome b5-like heme/steroid binding domain-containing protein n=1 Tax=Rhodocollybia butyracea TaxID=206335 RepID=A0A9P5UF28_9AGAR|nr:cytochrome b5-like heme/steroid binding domain-containing protein [Rhodocollybia butyracea]
MSWFKTSITGEDPEPYVEPEDAPKVRDPSIPNRMVTDKAANKPFLSYKTYREKQKQLHEKWLERQKIRKEKIARGEEVGPEERDPTEPEEVGLVGLLKFIVCVIALFAVTGKLFAGSYTWNYESKLEHLKTFIPTDQRYFSERTLATYDGSLSGKPIYLAIDGDVYDVTKGKAYQPGGSYHYFTGIDAARAFGTGCIQARTHLTHDLRGLTQDEIKTLEHWKDFYANHKDYKKVGRVAHKPIDPSSPIPEHCKDRKDDKSEKGNKKGDNVKKEERPTTKETVHEEL